MGGVDAGPLCALGCSANEAELTADVDASPDDAAIGRESSVDTSIDHGGTDDGEARVTPPRRSIAKI